MLTLNAPLYIRNPDAWGTPLIPGWHAT